MPATWLRGGGEGHFVEAMIFEITAAKVPSSALSGTFSHAKRHRRRR